MVHTPAPGRSVVFADGVRTPFGKARPDGIHAQTRADDLVVACLRELLRRNPSLPPERIEEVAVAAATQSGDQGWCSAAAPPCSRACRSRRPGTPSTAGAPAR